MSDDAKWERNDEAEAIVAELVPKYHQHLERARIVCFSKPKASSRHGKVVMATLQKATPLMRALIEPGRADYVMVIGGPVWEKLTVGERRALVDHELCHAAGYDAERETWLLEGHDIEEFAAIIRRHGAWKPDVERFLEVAQAVKLPQFTLDRAFREHQETMRRAGVSVSVESPGTQA